MSEPRSSTDSINEHSPLVPPVRDQDEDWSDLEPLSTGLSLDDKALESKSTFYLSILTLGIVGLQIVWSVELSNGSPYLLSLGMSKSLLAMVWIAGPLTGVLVQPYIGIRSDNCRISWGKRKPFILGGGAATIVSLLLLAWVREIVGGALAVLGVSRDSAATINTIIFFATIAMYVLDFAINTIQAGLRAFIVDNAPAHQQEAANAWASIMTGIGNVIGYVVAYLDLPNVFPFFGNSQFKVLGVISCITLASTVLISCGYIKERDPTLDDPPEVENPGLVAFFKQVYHSIKRLPPQIRKICEVQFFSWFGWFPFLFYITTYVGQLYVDPILVPDMPKADLDKLWEKATRVGTLALLINSIICFITNMALPFVVEPIYDPDEIARKSETIDTSITPSRSRSTLNSSAGDLRHLTTHSTTPLSKNLFTRLQARITHHLQSLRIPNLTLRRAWIFSQLFYALCMLSTFLISSPFAATIMATFIGIPWAVTLWIPFALISAEVAQQDQDRRLNKRKTRRNVRHSRHHSTHPNPEDGDNNPLMEPSLDAEANPSTASDPPPDQAGMILGLHNVAISFPQILATLAGSVIFKVLQKDRGTPGDTSVAWVLRLGGVASLVAAWWGRGLVEKKMG